MASYRALWVVHGPNGPASPGSILDLDDDSAKSLLALGAIEVAPEIVASEKEKSTGEALVPGKRESKQVKK